VQEKSTRFDLAIECGNLEVALETAKAIDREDCWSKLAQQALKQGNHKVVEIAYQRTKNFDRLSFLYLVTANPDKLAKMAKIAEMRGDHMSRFHNALYLGDVPARIAVLQEVGLCKVPIVVSLYRLISGPSDPLAYLTAKTNGLEDLAKEVLAEAGLTEDDVSGVQLPAKRSTLAPPAPINPAFSHNWPTIGVKTSFFDRALAATTDGETDANPQENGYQEESPQTHLDTWTGGDAVEEEPLEEAEDAWDLAAEEIEPAVDGEDVLDESAEQGEVAMATGASEAEIWVRNSPLAADHIAAGSFETAMQVSH